MKIGITLGDPAGIGPEIILKAASYIKRVNNVCIYGSKRLLRQTAVDLRLLHEYKELQETIVDCIDSIPYRYGKPTKATGRIALQSLKSALNDQVDVLVTPPIVKDVIRYHIRNFTGHTEYLGRHFNTKSYAMVGSWRTKRIMLLTTHMPLRRIFKHVTQRAVFEKIVLLNWGLKRYFSVETPRIGVSALNPHAFEFSLGEEEKITRAIAQARQNKINAQGPYPADTLFDRDMDGFLTMYHDQAMIYLKSKNNGINFTLGLPIIRLSPLYGAALDIAGTNKAEASGFVTAIKQGIQLYRNAKKHDKKYS
jgi:4-hydroxythreonine-4-phosphate dehydrogenase